MKKLLFNTRQTVWFKQFSNKGYALFASLSKVVLISVLSVPMLAQTKQGKLTAHLQAADDTLARQEMKLDEVVVTGTRAPLTALQSAKIVTVITRDDIDRAAVETVNDVLKLATGVDVRQRGGFGVQTDISINGGTFDQITILLNGVNISNPQTGHNATDFPVSLSDIRRIEVLEGAAARVFGTSAFNGAINIVTHRHEDRRLTAELQAGMHGTVTADAGFTLAGKNVRNHLSGGYARSDGGTENTGFDKGHFFYDGNWKTGCLGLSWQLGGSLQDYGAGTFYSAKFNNQWEKTLHVIGSVQATIDGLPHNMQISPTVYWNKFYDHYQLTKGATGAEAGENYHNMDVYGASVNAHMTWWAGKTAIGADVRKEHILSTALGHPLDRHQWSGIHGSDRMYDHKAERTNTGIFAEHNIIVGGFTLSAGILVNRNTGLDGKFRVYPGVDVSYRPSDSWKFYLSWNKALRMPTYTDLYIANSIQQGDRSLLPERNSTCKAGMTFSASGVRVIAGAFYSKGSDMIDWVYADKESTTYKAMNIGRLDNMGYSAEMTLTPADFMYRPVVTHIRIGYARIHQQHTSSQPIYRSLYNLEYLRHKVTLSLGHRIWQRLSANWSVRWQQRMNGYHPYAKIDGKVMWKAKKYSLFVKADNLTNHRYYDLGDVRQPGLWIMTGAQIKL